MEALRLLSISKKRPKDVYSTTGPGGFDIPKTSRGSIDTSLLTAAVYAQMCSEQTGMFRSRPLMPFEGGGVEVYEFPDGSWIHSRVDQESRYESNALRLDVGLETVHASVQTRLDDEALQASIGTHMSYLDLARHAVSFTDQTVREGAGLPVKVECVQRYGPLYTGMLRTQVPLTNHERSRDARKSWDALDYMSVLLGCRTFETYRAELAKIKRETEDYVPSLRLEFPAEPGFFLSIDNGSQTIARGTSDGEGNFDISYVGGRVEDPSLTFLDFQIMGDRMNEFFLETA